jgi:integrase
LLSAFTSAFILVVATLYKRPNSPYWIAQYFDANGSRVNKSTKSAHKGKDGEKPSPTVKRIAAGFEADARKTQKGQGELQKKFSAAIESASRAAGENKLTLELAKAFIEKLHRDANPDFVPVSVRNIFDDWLDTKSRLSASTYKLYEDAKRHLLLALGENAFGSPAHLLKMRDLEKALVTLHDSGLRGSTINLSLSVWRSVMRHAVIHNVLTKSPADGVKGLPTTDSVKRAPFTPQEARALLAACDNEWRGLILVAAHTGIRMKDCSSLRKRNVVDGNIIIKPTKTARLDKVISVPVTATLAAWIEEQPKDLLFPKLSKSNKSTLSEKFKAIMKKAEVPDTITLPTGEIRTRSFHSLRHPANSWLHNSGVDIATRQEILGHSSAAQNLEYTTSDPEVRRKAMALLPDLMAK